MMKEKYNKNLTEAYFGVHWWLLVIPLIIYTFMAFREIDLPGLYMDSVNPDYMAVWLIKGSHHIPSWLYPDNYFGHYPLLNSLYGGNITAYLGLFFFKIAGFGLVEVRVFHALLGILVLVSMSWCFHKWKVPRFASSVALCLLAIDPTFLFAWRTQYYLQLVPVIFLSIGLGLLGEHNQRINSGFDGRRHLFFCGIFLGFSAYCYFIFAFYAAVIVAVYINYCRHKLPLNRVAIPLIAGTALGWLPYFFAHVSIILNTNFNVYLEDLRILQTNYGVGVESQGGFIDRVHIVSERLGYLVAGRSLQINVFGNGTSSSFVSILHFLTLFGGTIFFLIYSIVGLIRQSKPVISWNETPLRLYATMMIAIIVVHLVFGLIVGRPLNLQHYVMLLPVLYTMTAIAIVCLWDSLVFLRQFIDVSRGIMVAFCLGMIATNFSLSWGIIDRLKQTGGVQMYSDAINVLAAHIQTLNPETVLLFPQWGYWMGVVTFTGPKFSSYETSSLKDMQVKLDHDTDLLKQQSFAMVLGAESLKDGIEATRKKLEEFARASKLQIGNISYCLGRNGSDQLWLIQMKRITVVGAYHG